MGASGFYEIALQRITAVYNLFSFDGIVSIGSSGGRYHEQSRVNLSFIVTSPASQIAKMVFEYSGFDCSNCLRLTTATAPIQSTFTPSRPLRSLDC